MSAHSTLYISRDAALLAIARIKLDFSDAELEEALDRFLEERLYNVRVGFEERDDDEFLRAMSL